MLKRSRQGTKNMIIDNIINCLFKITEYNNWLSIILFKIGSFSYEKYDLRLSRKKKRKV